MSPKHTRQARLGAARQGWAGLGIEQDTQMKEKDEGTVAAAKTETALKNGVVHQESELVVIRPLNFQQATVRIAGTAPYMQLRFSQKSLEAMAGKMAEGQQSRGKKVRAPRDFNDDYLQAMYVDENQQNGIPASAFRNAMISACRTVGFKMTIAKLSLFVEADGLDAIDGTPLVRIFGTPESTNMHVRNATGVADIRVRPMWREWYCDLRLRWDGDQFGADSVMNLLQRAGQQVGVGEGRPDSRSSAGIGYGFFTVVLA